MIGYATIAREAGFDVWMTVITTITVFGMPGQVAMASLFAVGAPLFLVFTAVAMANMRMLLMVVSGSDILQLRQQQVPFWQQVLLCHIMAITSWVQIGYVQDRYKPADLLAYYTGFATTIASFAVAGSLAGFFIADVIPAEILRVLIFITPLYILLLVINARQPANRIAVVVGGALCPFFYPLVGSWAIFIAGLIAGAVAIYAKQRWLDRRQDG